MPTLRSIIDGASAIDLRRLELSSAAEATSFLAAYGFDWDDAAHRRDLEAIRCESISFVERELLVRRCPVPTDVREQSDIRSLLLWASERAATRRQAWACALLRVMHASAHAPSFLESAFGDAIRAQIMSRFDGHIVRRPQGPQLGEGPDAIRLVAFDERPPKTRTAVLTKLLHAPENTATEIFDRLGVRFVTEDRFDALLVVKYLRLHNVIMFANTTPSRARNTLVDLDLLTGALERGRQDGDPLEPDIGRLRAQVLSHPPPGREKRTNPFSAAEYRSIQITCREMIRLPANVVRDGTGPARFFFPFEVQIMPRTAFEATRVGPGAHGAYRERQLDVVRERVLGPLFPAGDFAEPAR